MRCKAFTDDGYGPRCTCQAWDGNYGFCRTHRQCANERPRANAGDDMERAMTPGTIKFLRAMSGTLVQRAGSDAAYAGGTHNDIDAYINAKVLHGAKVKYAFSYCYYRPTSNVMRAEDELLSKCPALNTHRLSNLGDEPGYVYVLVGLRRVW